MSDLSQSLGTRGKPATATLEWLALVYVGFGLYLLYVWVDGINLLFSQGRGTVLSESKSVFAGSLSAADLYAYVHATLCILMSAVIIAGAAALWLRRAFDVCLAATVAVCLLPPLGPVGGAFGFAVLLRRGTRQLFKGEDQSDSRGWWGMSNTRSASLLKGAFLISAGYSLLVRAPQAILVYLESSQTLSAGSFSFGGALRELWFPALAASSVVREIWIPVILGAVGIACAILLHRRKAPRTLMGLALLHTAALPLGTIAGVFTLLWCQEVEHLEFLRESAPSESNTAARLLLTPEEEEKFRKSLGMG